MKSQSEQDECHVLETANTTVGETARSENDELDACELLLRYANQLVAPLKSGDSVLGSWEYVQYDIDERGFILRNSESNDKIIIVIIRTTKTSGKNMIGQAFKLSIKKEKQAAPPDTSVIGGEKNRVHDIIKLLFGKIISRVHPETFNRFIWIRDIVRLEKEYPISSNGIIIRLGNNCNQKCHFCPIHDDNTITMEEHDQVIFTIKYLKWKKAHTIIFSGGEPTLDPHLREYVQAARGVDDCKVVIQTNGMRLANAEYTESLKNAGLSSLMISLHSHIPSVSDQITNASGGFQKTLQGIINAIEQDIVLNMNCVICELNYKGMKDYIEFLYEKLPRFPELMTISYVAPVFMEWERTGLIPRMTDVTPYLFEALDYAENIGMNIIIPSICGIPYCLMGNYVKFHEEHALREVFPSRDKEIIASCRKCSRAQRCGGIWKNYMHIHGADEFIPLPPESQILTE